jgi:hypothetical protein
MIFLRNYPLCYLVQKNILGNNKYIFLPCRESSFGTKHLLRFGRIRYHSSDRFASKTKSSFEKSFSRFRFLFQSCKKNNEKWLLINVVMMASITHFRIEMKYSKVWWKVDRKMIRKLSIALKSPQHKLPTYSNNLCKIGLHWCNVVLLLL